VKAVKGEIVMLIVTSVVSEYTMLEWNWN